MVGVPRDCKQMIGHGMFYLEHQEVEIIEVGCSKLTAAKAGAITKAME